MIFASDLDRTLIYSDKFLQSFSGQAIAVETGKYFSYMTERSVDLLKHIVSKAIFVPCTTRTIEQYQRIQFFQNVVTPKFSVVSNGANLLVDGALDIGYNKKIHKTIADECAAGEVVLREFYKLAGDQWTQPIRQADGAFYYCIIDRDKAPLQELADFSRWAQEQKWDISIQGRKLYLVPQVINKWSAIKRVAEITGDDRIIGAGDSLLDMPLIKGAHNSISPAHGELYDQFGKSGNFLFTQSSGMIAGEEILNKVVSWLISE
ncbi:MAG: hypothetical protein JL50_14050 [Peptococcaceae bacterium BICA1-7]|nr:MAG: hypothetical protein JL50_14050 [Peptococcaceae bacterium BICA1-7]HBV96437.1 hypothetical protein [Desulfotomaculum sp.]